MRILLVIFFVLSSLLSVAQGEKRPGLLGRYIQGLIHDTGNVANPRFLIYPTLGYAPETSWELGLSSLYVYYANRDTNNRLSEVTGFTFYTLENQYGFWFDHALYSDHNKWFFLGRLRFQSFPLFYYGIGADSPPEHQALAEGVYTLVKERVLREVYHSFYIGVEFDYQRFHHVHFQQIDEVNPIEVPPGGNGSTNYGAGLGIVYDNRHNVLNVRHGLFSELAFLRYDKSWGSDFSFTTMISDTRIYRTVKHRNVFAAQLYGQFTFAGHAPFNQMALLGGETLMRGYYYGRFRDDHYMAGQVEYRMLPVSFTKRWGATVFLAAGQVFSQDSELHINKFLPAGGGGIRFKLFEKKDIWSRLDIAFTGEGQGYYIMIGEAF